MRGRRAVVGMDMDMETAITGGGDVAIALEVNMGERNLVADAGMAGVARTMGEAMTMEGAGRRRCLCRRRVTQIHQSRRTIMARSARLYPS